MAQFSGGPVPSTAKTQNRLHPPSYTGPRPLIPAAPPPASECRPARPEAGACEGSQARLSLRACFPPTVSHSAASAGVSPTPPTSASTQPRGPCSTSRNTSVSGTGRRGLCSVAQDCVPRCVPKRTENVATQHCTRTFPLFKVTNRWKRLGRSKVGGRRKVGGTRHTVDEP